MTGLRSSSTLTITNCPALKVKPPGLPILNVRMSCVSESTARMGTLMKLFVAEGAVAVTCRGAMGVAGTVPGSNRSHAMNHATCVANTPASHSGVSRNHGETTNAIEGSRTSGVFPRGRYLRRSSSAQWSVVTNARTEVCAGSDKSALPPLGKLANGTETREISRHTYWCGRTDCGATCPIFAGNSSSVRNRRRPRNRRSRRARRRSASARPRVVRRPFRSAESRS